MVLKIVQNPNLVLQKTAERVTNFKDKNLAELIQDMNNTLRHEDALGLAAPQIGVSKAIFVIPPDYAPVVRTLRVPLSFISPLRPTVYINPKIKKYSKTKTEMEEGCLSIRGEYYPITRPEKITLMAQTQNGQKFTVTVSGLLAKILQHETDHLNGKLIINRIHER
jgi:peptide deformylase